MEVVGGWWLWFVPDRGEGNNIQSSPKEQNKRKKNVEEKKSNIRIEGERETAVESVQGHESLHSLPHSSSSLFYLT
jgi:hypothetical protein